MNLQSKFGNCITTQFKILHFICKQEGIMDRQTDRQTTGRTDGLIFRCPQQTLQEGRIKIVNLVLMNSILLATT